MTRTPHIFEKITYSETETGQFGRFFSRFLHSGDIVALFGDVGSGKTVFVKGICESLQAEEPVNSPTFIILNEYSGQLDGKVIQIHHFDFYRIENPGDLSELDLQDYIGAKGSVSLIEWSEHIEHLLNGPYWKAVFEKQDDNQRRIRIEFLQ